MKQCKVEQDIDKIRTAYSWICYGSEWIDCVVEFVFNYSFASETKIILGKHEMLQM